MNYDLATPVRVTSGQTVYRSCARDRNNDQTPAQAYVIFAEGMEDEMCFATCALVPDK